MADNANRKGRGKGNKSRAQRPGSGQGAGRGLRGALAGFPAGTQSARGSAAGGQASRGGELARGGPRQGTRSYHHSLPVPSLPPRGPDAETPVGVQAPHHLLPAVVDMAGGAALPFGPQAVAGAGAPEAGLGNPGAGVAAPVAPVTPDNPLSRLVAGPSSSARGIQSLVSTILSAKRRNRRKKGKADPAYLAWLRVQRNLLRTRMGRMGEDKTTADTEEHYFSAGIPTTFAEFARHTTDVVKSAQSQYDRGLRSFIEEQKKAERSGARPFDAWSKLPLSNDGRGSALHQPTVFTPAPFDVVNRPLTGASPWPSSAELMEEGDERHTSGFQRMLPPPRIRAGNDTVNFKQLPYRGARAMDRVRPVPTLIGIEDDVGRVSNPGPIYDDRSLPGRTIFVEKNPFDPLTQLEYELQKCSLQQAEELRFRFMEGEVVRMPSPQDFSADAVGIEVEPKRSGHFDRVEDIVAMQARYRRPGRRAAGTAAGAASAAVVVVGGGVAGAAGTGAGAGGGGGAQRDVSRARRRFRTRSRRAAEPTNAVVMAPARPRDEGNPAPSPSEPVLPLSLPPRPGFNPGAKEFVPGVEMWTKTR